MSIVIRAVAIVILLTLVPSPCGAAGQDAEPRIVRTKSAAPIEVDGVPCAAGHVFREEESGRLRRCTLGRDAVVHHADLKKGSIVALDADGSIRYVFLPGTTMVGEHSCRGRGHGWMTLFHPNGRLKLCWLSRREVIQGVPCSKATFLGEFFGRKHASAEFHENGALASCVASAGFELGGRRYRAGERARLDPGGTPAR